MALLETELLWIKYLRITEVLDNRLYINRSRILGKHGSTDIGR